MKNFKLFLTQIYQIAGQTIPDNFDFIVEETLKIIPASFTGPMVEYAFKKGVYKYYGDYSYLSVVLFNEWIKGFKNSSVYDAFPVNHLQIEEKTKPTDQEIYDTNVRIFKNAFSEYKKTRKYNDYGNLLYEFLVKEGKINLTVEQKKDIYSRAKSNLTANFQRKTSGETLDRYIKQITDNDGVIVTESKRIALYEFFDKMIELDYDCEMFFE